MRKECLGQFRLRLHLRLVGHSLCIDSSLSLQIGSIIHVEAISGMKDSSINHSRSVYS